MGKPLIFNIQKYSIHDGEGIRTTVFFKGCPLSCKWCHNPESQRFEKELLFHGDRCTGCGACSRVCPVGAISWGGGPALTDGTCTLGQGISAGDSGSVPGSCIFGQDLPADDSNSASGVGVSGKDISAGAPGSESGTAVSDSGAVPRTNRSLCRVCGACVAACPHNAREEAGKEYELTALIRELEKDRMFYDQSGGGITLSGGEPLAQDMDYIEELAKRLHAKGYSVNIDTCGCVPYGHIRRVLPYTDTFLYDIKLLDSEAHRQFTGVDNRLILENLKALSADGGKINLRLPLIDGVNATEKHLTDILQFLQNNAINPYRINLLKYHSTGSGKYARLDRLYDHSSMAVPDDQWLDQAVSLFKQSGFHNIQIGG